MAITSDEVNYLVYRYLQECGFMHSAFTFAYESQLAKSTVLSTELPPGALVSFIQKGLQYVGIEAHINEDGTERECEGEISLLNPHICRVAQSVTNSAKSTASKSSNKRKRKAVEPVEATADGTKATEVNGVEKVDNDSLMLLSGHEKEVYNCLWNPVKNILVSGSSDSTARIWEISADLVTGKHPAPAPVVLSHGSGPQKDVTTLEWNHDGSFLASGTYNGKTRIWTSSGEMSHVFQYHNGPVFATRWSKSSAYLLSASYDKTVSIWDMAAASKHQQIKLHDEPILDASWKDDSTFATCSADKRICITRVGETQADLVLRGHTDAINSVKWDPSGRLLASCSDDYTVKVWDPVRAAEHIDNGSTKMKVDEDDSSSPVATGGASVEKDGKSRQMYLHNLQEHKKEVYTFRWSSTGPGSALPNGPLSLASASFDSTVKLWDVERGVCNQTFEHQQPVYGVAYSPNGDFLASGTIGGIVSVWSLKDGTLVKTYQASGDIYDVSWNRDGDLIAACAASGDVAIINFRL
ncbi:hypothetical protein PINS_up011191 [Pythium insidiosum]|nr:hypothetical protein PINS_up011191 [Pythium insidiosum]